MVTYVDKLSEFGKSFQVKTIYSLIHDLEFLQNTYDVIKSDYFESDTHQWIVSKIIDYYTEYKNHMTMDVFSVAIKSINSESFLDRVRIDLKEIYLVSNTEDLDFIKEQFHEFCKNQTLKQAILESADLLKRGDYDSIKAKIDTAMKAGMAKEIGHNWKEHVNIRLENLRNPVTTNMEAIDNITDGGLGGGEIGVAVAASGIGKSWVLCQLGFNAAKAGMNVLHITLELSDEYVGRRYDTILTGTPFTILRDNKDLLLKKLDTISGSIDIKAFPTRGVTVHGLEAYVEKVIQLKPIDLIILDYADLLGRPRAASGNDYEDMGGIYEELRGISSKLKIPVWTASQANRSSLQQDTIGADNIADSYKKVMTADFIFSIIRKDIDKLDNKARIHIIKNRFGPDGMTFDCAMDTNTGKFHIYDKQVDNRQVEAKQEKLEKKNLKSKFDSFKPKKDFG